MKILITGANGMLGSSLCRIYSNRYEVFAFHRDSHCFSVCSSSFSMDLLDTDQLKYFFNKIKPDIVFHCAGITNVDVCENNPGLAYDSNVKITENISRICSNSIKLIYISTDQVYGLTDGDTEVKKNLQPFNHYGKTKLYGEQKVQEFCTDYIILRTNIFGWNVKPKRISSAEWMYYSLKNGEEITLFTDYTFSPIYTEYLGNIAMELIDMGFKGIINAGSPIPCSKYDFGICLAEEYGLDLLLIKKGSIASHLFTAPRVHKLDLNIKKLFDTGISVPKYHNSISQFALNRKKITDT